MRRYLRAFVIALRLTLRGQRLAPRHPELTAWAAELAQRLDAVEQAARRDGLDAAARQRICVRLDGRDLSLERALAALRHHAAVEYPSLLRSGSRYDRLAISAHNLNDRALLARLLAAPELQRPALLAALAALRDHLDSMPQPPPDTRFS